MCIIPIRRAVISIFRSRFPHRVRLRGNGIRMEKNIRNANSAWEMALRVRKFTIRNTETGIITVFPAKG